MFLSENEQPSLFKQFGTVEIYGNFSQYRLKSIKRRVLFLTIQPWSTNWKKIYLKPKKSVITFLTKSRSSVNNEWLMMAKDCTKHGNNNDHIASAFSSLPFLWMPKTLVSKKFQTLLLPEINYILLWHYEEKLNNKNLEILTVKNCILEILNAEKRMHLVAIYFVGKQHSSEILDVIEFEIILNFYVFSQVFVIKSEMMTFYRKSFAFF